MTDLDELSRVIGQIEGTQRALLATAVELKEEITGMKAQLSHIEKQNAGYRIETAKLAGSVSVLMTLLFTFLSWINPFK